MGLDLPGELRSLLSLLGYNWPEADEVKLIEMGQAWISFAGTLGDLVQSANSTAGTVWSTNQGGDIKAFQDWWSKPDSPGPALSDGTTAAPTFGASLLEIPVFQQLARTIIENLIQDAVFQLVDG